MKLAMDRKHTKDCVQKFLSVICPKDQTTSTGAVIGKTKREQIFEELNQMIAYTKRLEFEIKRGMDTPLRMFRILLTRHTQAMKYPTTQASQPYAAVKEAYFMEDIKLDDLSKVMKFANQLLGANP